MIHEIPCPGIIRIDGPRQCGANLYNIVRGMARGKTGEVLRVHCPLCENHVLVTLEWEQEPVIISFRAFPEEV